MTTRQMESMIREAGGFLERNGRHKVYRIGDVLFNLHHGPKQDGRCFLHLKSVLRKIDKKKVAKV